MTEKKKVNADICSYVDEETSELKLEITLPGVARENIKLRMLDDGFNLLAPREDFDYVGLGNFCCPVRASDARADYENGLLKLSVPFKDPMEDAREITIH